MFVIDTLDDEGNIDRTCLPIYGCLFGDDEMVDLLASHLRACLRFGFRGKKRQFFDETRRENGRLAIAT
jgi:hypothetical protein